MLSQHSLSNFLYVEKICQGTVEGTIFSLMNWTIVRMHYLIYGGALEDYFLKGLTWKKMQNFYVPAITINVDCHD